MVAKVVSVLQWKILLISSSEALIWLVEEEEGETIPYPVGVSVHLLISSPKKGGGAGESRQEEACYWQSSQGRHNGALEWSKHFTGCAQYFCTNLDCLYLPL